MRELAALKYGFPGPLKVLQDLPLPRRQAIATRLLRLLVDPDDLPKLNRLIADGAIL